MKKAGAVCKSHCQVGRSGVDRASSSDARGPGFEPGPLRFKKYHFFTPKLKGSLRSRVHPQISESSERGGVEPKKYFLGENNSSLSISTYIKSSTSKFQYYCIMTVLRYIDGDHTYNHLTWMEHPFR